MGEESSAQEPGAELLHVASLLHALPAQRPASPTLPRQFHPFTGGFPSPVKQNSAAATTAFDTVKKIMRKYLMHVQLFQKQILSIWEKEMVFN